MIKRTIKTFIERQLTTFPVVVLTGPRQVGKSTLAYELVREKGFEYVSLDDLDRRRDATQHPRAFIEKYALPLVIDEVQYVPAIFDAILSIVNEYRLSGKNANGLFLLTGSQNFSLMQGVTETLAGRVSVTNLHGLSLSEIKERSEQPFILTDDRLLEKRGAISEEEVFSYIIRGSYPELYRDLNVGFEDFYRNYVKTYIERDVTQLINIKDHLAFDQFMRILAAHTGQELVLDAISKSLGKPISKIKEWISVLMTSGIIFMLEPYYETSIVKRIVKRPKLYFSDTGLAAYLIRMNDVEQMIQSPYSGAFFETFVINQIKLSFENNGMDFNASYYRDNNQNEIDLILVNKGILQRYEIKKGTRYHLSDIKSFGQLKKTQYRFDVEGILCLTSEVVSLNATQYLIPITLI